MRLSAPKNVTFYIAVIIGVLGLIGVLVSSIPVLGQYGVWLVVIGFVILALGNLLEGF